MTSQTPQSWQHQGCVSLWRYTGANQSYRGWHLSADKDGCRSMLALLSAFSNAPLLTYRTVALTAPSEVLLDVPGKRSWDVHRVAKLRLSQSASRDDWRIVEDGNTASLLFGENWSIRLSEGILALSNGDGDFSIGPEDRDQRLWFWWWRQ